MCAPVDTRACALVPRMQERNATATVVNPTLDAGKAASVSSCHQPATLRHMQRFFDSTEQELMDVVEKLLPQYGAGWRRVWLARWGTSEKETSRRP